MDGLKHLKKFLTLGVTLITLAQLSTTCFAMSSKVTADGCFLDMRNQFSCDGVIAPPHPENIPEHPEVQETVTSFEQYYDVNYKGYRRGEDKLPLVPGYTAHYSTRTPHPYTKQQYIDVWKTGKKVGKIDCLTDEYAISFFPVSNWAVGTSVACWRARRVPQKPACFLYVEDAGGQIKEMQQAKKWAELWGIKIFFGTIDQGIPVEW